MVEYNSGKDFSQESRVGTHAERVRNIRVGTWAHVEKWSEPEGHEGNLDMARFPVVVSINPDATSPRTFLLSDYQGRNRWAYDVKPADTDPNERARKAEAMHNALRQTHEEFKEKVVKVATDLAEEHDWCEVVDNALEEMGLPRRARRAEITFTVTVPLEDVPRDLMRRIEEDQIHDRWVTDTFAFSVTPDGDGGVVSGPLTVEVESAEVVE